jgi:hypothetical protein
LLDLLLSGTGLSLPLGLVTSEKGEETMESYTSMMRRKRHAERKRQILNAAGEVIGSIVFFAMLFGMCFLCTICSGYHWE